MSIATRRFAIGLSVFLAFLAGCYLGVNLALPGTMKKLFRDTSDTELLRSRKQWREAAARAKRLDLLPIRYA